MFNLLFIMDVINEIFSDLKFTKVDERGGYHIFAAGIVSSVMMKGKRYVFVYVPIWREVEEKHVPISRLPWTVASTRQLTNSYPMKEQVFNMKIPANDPICEVVERKEGQSRYFNTELDVMILHDPKKKTIYQYHNRMRLSNVIETWGCIIKPLTL